MPLPKAFEEAIGGAFEKNTSRGARYFNAANRVKLSIVFLKDFIKIVTLFNIRTLSVNMICDFVY